MAHLSTKRGELEIDESGVVLDESLFRIPAKVHHDLDRRGRRRYYLIVLALILSVGYLLVLFALDLPGYPREWAAALLGVGFLIPLLIFVGRELKRLRPIISSADYIPRDAIKAVFYSHGGRTHAPRFVIKFDDDGTTRYRLVEFNAIEPIDEGRQAFDSLGFDPEHPPPPIGLSGYIRRALGRKQSQTSMEPTPQEDAPRKPDARISRWWMLLVVPLALTLLRVVSGQFASMASGSGQSPIAALSFTLIFWILGFLTFPLAPIAMFLDARKIRSRAVNWNPRPLVWAVAGLVPMVLFVVAPTGMTITSLLVWGGYLVRRYAAVGFR